ncbi:hypothetical protein [Streptomyces gardneri]|uniref:hypothetical protein n=1 Tax=Streptomyces gardneri TaxID=66892 RepID=UPI0036872B25
MACPARRHRRLQRAWKGRCHGTAAAAGLSLALVTINTSRTRAAIAVRLAALGFPIGAGDILTAPAATATYLREHSPGVRCLLLLNSGDVRDDLAGVTLIDEGDADVVVLGDAGPEYGHEPLNRVFRQLQRVAQPGSHSPSDKAVSDRYHGRAEGAAHRHGALRDGGRRGKPLR